MPNWCGNTMVVMGDYNELKDFQQKLLHARQVADELKNWHLYQIYEEFGLKNEEVLERSDYIRGYFTDIEKTISLTSNGTKYFKVWYESAWGPMIEGFDFLLSHYKTLKQYTIAEECGCEVYINTDTTGEFFPEKYCLDVEDVDIYYPESDEELIKFFNDLVRQYTPKSKQVVCKSVNDIYKFLANNDFCLNAKDETEHVSLNEYGTY